MAPVGLDTLVNVTIAMQAAKRSILRLDTTCRMLQRLRPLLVGQGILDLVHLVAREKVFLKMVLKNFGLKRI